MQMGFIRDEMNSTLSSFTHFSAQVFEEQALDLFLISFFHFLSINWFRSGF